MQRKGVNKMIIIFFYSVILCRAKYVKKREKVDARFSQTKNRQTTADYVQYAIVSNSICLTTLDRFSHVC